MNKFFKNHERPTALTTPPQPPADAALTTPPAAEAEDAAEEEEVPDTPGAELEDASGKEDASESLLAAFSKPAQQKRAKPASLKVPKVVKDGNTRAGKKKVIMGPGVRDALSSDCLIFVLFIHFFFNICFIILYKTDWLRFIFCSLRR